MKRFEDFMGGEKTHKYSQNWHVKTYKTAIKNKNSSKQGKKIKTDTFTCVAFLSLFYFV